ncbi:hypothetical protein TNCV_4967471 [Trichonephila clavipes]|nr:hypothetical protein TNCV_4967471 [Trichonephila clavipes]
MLNMMSTTICFYLHVRLLKAALTGNIAHMVGYAFFKDGYRYDGIAVDHSLEISPQSKVSRIQVGESKRPSLTKMRHKDSVVTEMVAEYLFQIMGDVGRSTILHKHCGCITSPCLKSQNKKILQE